MSLKVDPSGASCGASITGVQLNQSLSDDLVAEIRAHWLEHKVVAFPISSSHPRSWWDSASNSVRSVRIRFSVTSTSIPRWQPYSATLTEDLHLRRVFSQRLELYAGPASATALYGVTIPPVGGDTLFADQVAAYEKMPDDLRARVRKISPLSTRQHGLRARWRLRRGRSGAGAEHENSAQCAGAGNL